MAISADELSLIPNKYNYGPDLCFKAENLIVNMHYVNKYLQKQEKKKGEGTSFYFLLCFGYHHKQDEKQWMLKYIRYTYPKLKNRFCYRVLQCIAYVYL